MALDIAQDRMAALNPACPWRGAMVDATIASFTAGNRQAAAYLYSGIAAEAAASVAIHGFKGRRPKYRKTVTYADGTFKVAEDEKEYRRLVQELVDKMARDEEQADASPAPSNAQPAVRPVRGLLSDRTALLQGAELLDAMDPMLVRQLIEDIRKREELALLYILAEAA